MPLRRLVPAIALLASFGVPAAYADDRATAQELFQEGKALVSAGKIAEACPKFAGAAELSPTAGVRLNLADCYEKLGRTASAWAMYDEALTIADRAGDAAAVDLARKRLVALKPQLSYLTVRLSPDAAATAGLEVTRDAERLPQAAWGTPVPVDPGDHEVKASAPGRAPWSTKVSVTTPGAQAEVAVPGLLELASGANPPAPEEAVRENSGGAAAVETSAQDRRDGLFAGKGGTQRVLALTAAGLGVVGVGVGSYFGITMLSRKSDYQRHQAPDGRCLDLTCQMASHDAVAAGNAATVSFIAGGVLLAAGAALWWTAPRGASPTGATVVPMATAHGAGLGAIGTW